MESTSRRTRKRKPKPARGDRRSDDHRWKLSLLREYVATHGWSTFRKDTVVAPGVNLFTWVHGRRQAFRTDEIADWLVAECEAIPGWTWDHWHEHHRRIIDGLRAVVREQGWEAVSNDVVIDGAPLGSWLMNRRREYHRKTHSLEPWIITALEAIHDWSWDPRHTHYAKNLRELRGHVARHGWTGFGITTRSRNDVNIGKWANHIRDVHRRGRVPRWLVAGLETIPGWVWEPLDARRARNIALLCSFVEQHGWDALKILSVFRGARIGAWVYRCRSSYVSNTLAPSTIAALEEIAGWRW